MRKPVRIAFDEAGNLTVLADDGSVWNQGTRGGWYRHPSLPQPGSMGDQFYDAPAVRVIGGDSVMGALNRASLLADEKNRAVGVAHNEVRILVRPGNRLYDLYDLWQKRKNSTEVLALPEDAS